MQVPLHLDSRSSQQAFSLHICWENTNGSAQLNFMECTHLRSTLCFGCVCYSCVLFYVPASGVAAQLVSSEPIVVD